MNDKRLLMCDTHFIRGLHMQIKRSIWISAILVIVVFLSLMTIFNAKEKGVRFLDPNLETAVHQQLGKPSGPIHKADVEKMEALSILAPLKDTESLFNHEDTLNLTGLEQCTGLKILMIFGAQISDLSPLSSLPNLESVILYSCDITDLSPLSNLPSLRFLSVTGSQGHDFSFLGTITGLSELHLGENGISDISMLSNLMDLTKLSLFGNRIDDVSSLSDLARLTELDLRNNEIKDIFPLAKLTNLTSLLLDNNQVVDLSPLAGNTKFRKEVVLGLCGNPLSEKSANVYIPQLKTRGFAVTWE